jgi:hypothetical protein
MNVLALEQRFKSLERREKDCRRFFDPKSSKGKKHLFINDIRADFAYDQIMYG